MKIYTKYGDQGFTRLVGGARVKKNHARVAAYGTIDELCCQVGFARSFLNKEDPLNQELMHIQQVIFDCSSDLAVPDEIRPYRTEEKEINWLEAQIDGYSEETPEIEFFILPGGTQAASALHVARGMTRRAEREAVSLMENGETVNPVALKYLNRLSDYFFSLARVVNARAGETDIFYHKSKKVFSTKKKE